MKKILVVDDEDDILHFLELVLREKGYQVVTASGGHEALTKAQLERPDLVLLDIMMPELSGFEVLEAMARDPSTSGIPVVVLAAGGDEVDSRSGLALGVRKHMSKPFDVRALVAEIRRHVGRSGRSDGERRATL